MRTARIRLHRLWLLASIALVFARPITTASTLRAAPAEAGSQLLADLARLDGKPLDDVWPAVDELKKTYQSRADDVKVLSENVYTLRGSVKIAGAALLFSRNEPPFQKIGQIALQQLARDAGEKPLRIAAIRLLKNPVRLEEAYITLKDIAASTDDADLKIEATLALWELDNHQSVIAPLIKMLDDKSASVRTSAALALAETGYTRPPVGELLRTISKQPSDAGRRAKLILRALDRDEGAASKTAASPAEPAAVAERKPPSSAQDWAALLAEVEQTIQKHSLYRDKAGSRELYLAALRGMASSLDEYSAFQDPDDVRLTEAGRLGTFWGLGADLVKPGKNAPLVVVKPYHEGPAYLAGIHAGDRILEVNGVTTHDRDRAELERLTASEPGGDVHLLVLRWGWTQPRMISVERGQVQVPSLRSQLLPARIGYIKLTRIGPAAALELEKAVDALEAAGLDALILDLRDNPGGNLKQAVRAVDLFVGERPQPIVTERAPLRVTEWSSSAGEKPLHPMAILVNRSTASAAEVVAGALQDFQRATVIGQTTFGKGVKQVTVQLSPAASALLGGESRLVLTAGRLYLPLGRSIQVERGRNGEPLPGQHGGVTPDIPIDAPDEAGQGRLTAELARVQYSPRVDGFIHENYTALKNLFEEGDVWDPNLDRVFEELYQSIGTKLTREEVRHALRGLIRKHLEDEKGEEQLTDLHDDAVLGRACLELCRKLGRDPAGVPEYRSILERRVKEQGTREE
jgi:carboxyl-terminal processing protease